MLSALHRGFLYTLLLLACMSLSGCFAVDEETGEVEIVDAGAPGEPEVEIVDAFRVSAGKNVIADPGTQLVLEGSVDIPTDANFSIVSYRWRVFIPGVGFETRQESATNDSYSPDLTGLFSSQAAELDASRDSVLSMATALGPNPSLAFQFMVIDSLGRSSFDVMFVSLEPIADFLLVDFPRIALLRGSSLTVNVLLSDAQDADVVVPYFLESETAVVGVDVTPCSPCEVTIPAGQRTASFVIQAPAVTQAAGAGQFTLRFGETTVPLASSPQYTLTVAEFDPDDVPDPTPTPDPQPTPTPEPTPTPTPEPDPDPASFTVVAQAAPTQGGSVSGADTYTEGDTVILTAIPAAGYQFLQWVTADGTVLSNQANFEFSAAADVDAIAQFERQRHEVTPSAGSGGSISPQSVQTVDHGVRLSFTVQPETGFEIALVEGSCGGALDGRNYVTNAITQDCTVEASFVRRTFAVTPSAETGGSITPAQSQTVAYGSSLQFSVQASTGYQVGGVSGTCGGALSGTTFTTNTITASCTVIANFTQNVYTVTPSASTGGTVTPATVQSGVHGTSLQFTLTPDTGHVISNVAGSCGGTLSGNTYTTAPLTANCTIDVNFDLGSVTVTASAGANGTISPAGAQLVVFGSNQVYTVTPDTGFSIASVDGTCGGSLSGNTYTTNAVTADCTVVASFVLAQYSVTPSAGTGGSITPSSAQTVSHSGTTSFSIAPDTGYSISSVSGTCGGTLSGNTYTTNAVTGDCTVVANFALNQYTVTPSAGSNGSITPSTAQSVAHGSNAAFTIQPDTGFEIDAVAGTCGGSLSGNTYTTNVVTGDCTVSATFKVAQYSVTPSAGTGGTITPNTVQTVAHGATTSFSLAPDTGYEIASVGGTCGGSLSGSTYTTNAVTANCTVSATFVLMSYVVTSTAGTGGTISPAGNQNVLHGNTTAFTLNPDTGYTVDAVTGCGGSLSGSTFTTGAITAACTVSATFKLLQPVKILAGGKYNACAEEGNGPQCWGALHTGLSSPPDSGSSTIVAMDSGDEVNCAVYETSGTYSISCWGPSKPSISNLSDLVTAFAGDALANIVMYGSKPCVRSTTDKVRCLDSDFVVFDPLSQSPTPALSLIGGSYGACATTGIGQAVCTSNLHAALSATNTSPVVNSLLPRINTLKKARFIERTALAQNVYWCGINNSNLVECGIRIDNDGTPSDTALTVPAAITNATDVALLVSTDAMLDVFACAIQNDNELICWNQSGTIVTPFSGISLTNPYKVSAFDDSHLCVADNNDIYCKATSSGKPFGVFQATAANISLHSQDNVCALNEGKIDCWNGINNPSVLFAPPVVPGVVPQALEAGGNTTCAWYDDQSIRCWGTQFGQGSSWTQATTTTGKPFAVGGDFICYEDTDEVKCSSGISTPPIPPAGTSGSKDLVAGTGHGCALIQKNFGGGVIGDNIDCWGNLLAAQNTVDHFNGDVPVLAIAAAGNSTCAMSQAQGLFCSGQDSMSVNIGFANLPADPKQIEMTTQRVCVRSDSELKCWNAGGSLLDDTPLNFKALSDVAMGANFYCVINNKRPQCWGNPIAISP